MYRFAQTNVDNHVCCHHDLFSLKQFCTHAASSSSSSLAPFNFKTTSEDDQSAQINKDRHTRDQYNSIIYLVDLSKKLNLCGWVGVTVRPISRVYYYYYYYGTRGPTK